MASSVAARGVTPAAPPLPPGHASAAAPRGLTAAPQPTAGAAGAGTSLPPSAGAEATHLEFTERLSRRVLASLRSLNDSLGEVRQSVAKIDSIAHARLNLSLTSTANGSASAAQTPATASAAATTTAGTATLVARGSATATPTVLPAATPSFTSATSRLTTPLLARPGGTVDATSAHPIAALTHAALGPAVPSTAAPTAGVAPQPVTTASSYLLQGILLSPDLAGVGIRRDVLDRVAAVARWDAGVVDAIARHVGGEAPAPAPAPPTSPGENAAPGARSRPHSILVGGGGGGGRATTLTTATAASHTVDFAPIQDADGPSRHTAFAVVGLEDEAVDIRPHTPGGDSVYSGAASVGGRSGGGSVSGRPSALSSARRTRRDGRRGSVEKRVRIHEPAGNNGGTGQLPGGGDVIDGDASPAGRGRQRRIRNRDGGGGDGDTDTASNAGDTDGDDDNDGSTWRDDVDAETGSTVSRTASPSLHSSRGGRRSSSAGASTDDGGAQADDEDGGGSRGRHGRRLGSRTSSARSMSPHSVRTHTPPPPAFLLHHAPSTEGGVAADGGATSGASSGGGAGNARDQPPHAHTHTHSHMSVTFQSDPVVVGRSDGSDVGGEAAGVDGASSPGPTSSRSTPRSPRTPSSTASASKHVAFAGVDEAAAVGDVGAAGGRRKGGPGTTSSAGASVRFAGTDDADAGSGGGGGGGKAARVRKLQPEAEHSAETQLADAAARKARTRAQRAGGDGAVHRAPAPAGGDTGDDDDDSGDDESRSRHSADDDDGADTDETPPAVMARGGRRLLPRHGGGGGSAAAAAPSSASSGHDFDSDDESDTAGGMVHSPSVSSPSGKSAISSRPSTPRGTSAGTTAASSPTPGSTASQATGSVPGSGEAGGAVGALDGDIRAVESRLTQQGMRTPATAGAPGSAPRSGNRTLIDIDGPQAAAPGSASGDAATAPQPLAVARTHHHAASTMNLHTAVTPAPATVPTSGPEPASAPVEPYSFMPGAPPAQLKTVAPRRYDFPRYSEELDAGVALDDDGTDADIPFAVSPLTRVAFAAMQDEAMELRRMKAQLQALKAAREAQKRAEDGVAAGATTAGAGAAAAAGAAAEDAFTIWDPTPDPEVQDWKGGDAPWPVPPADDDDEPDGDGGSDGEAADAGGDDDTGGGGAGAGAGAGVSADASGSRPRRRRHRRRRFEAFALRVVYEAGRTGFEETKDFTAAIGSVIAGRYKVHDYLGSAAFSSALSCADLLTGEDVCLKVIKNNKDFLDQSLDEIKLLRYINAQGSADEHHILRLLDYFYHKEHLFLVTELLKDNLYEFQKYLADAGEPPYFTLPRIQRITAQVLAALAFIHSRGLIHCDLKPENILIKSYSRCEVKVIDFGSSCFITDHLSTYIQSRSYRAPEVILGTPYGPKIDIWSLGCILCELLTGRVLFANDSIQTMLVRMQSLLGPLPATMLDTGREVPKYFTAKNVVYEAIDDDTVQLMHPRRTNLRLRLGCSDPDFLDFVSAMLAIDPDKRPTAAQALKHPWLTKYYDFEPYVLPQM